MRCNISACLLMLLLFATTGNLKSQNNVATQHNDRYRTGWNDGEYVLTQSNVRPGSFGKLFTRHVDDYVYAQPLVMLHINIPGRGLRNVVYVATESNTVYAFDADSASVVDPYWKVNLTNAHARPARNADLTKCSRGHDFLGNIGIVSTPVIDTPAKIMYVVTKVYDSATGKLQAYLHAIDILMGSEQANSPVLISASVAGNGDGNVGGTITFDALHENQRSALLLVNNLVIICFGSHCDWAPYHGWVMGYDKNSLEQKMVYNVTPEGEGGGIWMCGGGPSADNLDNIYFVTGDGTAGLNNNASNIINRGESSLKLTPSNNSFVVNDFFTPYNARQMDTNNTDISTQLLLIPRTNLGVFAAKDGKIFLININNMSGFHADSNYIVQNFSLNTSKTLHGSFSYYGGTKKEFVYIWPGASPLKALPFNRGNNKFDPDQIIVNQALITGSIYGGFMSVSSNGTADETAILWASHFASGNYNSSITNPGVLRAFAADDIRIELWNSTIDPGDAITSNAKFVCPTVANGKVYVPTWDNQLIVYGLKNGIPNTCNTENIALHKAAFASSVKGRNRATNATDGKENTAWVSNTTPRQYIYIDLANSYDICKVVLEWSNTKVKDFTIQVSDDALNWSTILTVKGNTYSVNNLLVNGSGRYVRMSGTAVRGTSNYSLKEFKVYGKPNTTLYTNVPTKR